MTEKIEFCKKIVLRTPNLPRRQSVSQEQIKEFLDRKDVLEAIFVASPSLYWEIKKWQRGELEKKKEERLFISSYKYLLRMMNRATPFGLFSGCEVIEWGETSQIEIPQLSQVERHTRLDMHYLCKLVESIGKLEFVRKKLHYFPNSSINKKSNKLSYVEYTYKNGSRFHSSSEVELDEYLQLILTHTAHGKTYSEILNVLLAYDEEIEEEEANQYLFSLIDAQILVSELYPSVTGDEYLSNVLKILKRISVKDEKIQVIYQRLNLVNQSLSQIDLTKDKDVNRYRSIQNTLKDFQVEIEEAKLFQVDTSKESSRTNNTLSVSFQKEIEDCISFMLHMYKHFRGKNLEDFVMAFLKRYETEEVDLLTVLDTERGLGYPIQDSKIKNPLTEDLKKSYTPQNSFSSIQLSNWETLLLHELHKNRTAKAIDISKIEGIEKRENPSVKFPPSLSVFFKIFFEQESPHIFLKFISGNSGTNLLARFAHSSKAVHEFVQEIATHEEKIVQAENAILAEVAHLPDDRLGNVVIRPSFRKFEIPYLAHSRLEEEHKIPLTSLKLSIDSYTKEVFLTSKKLGKRVIPRHSNAYNALINKHPAFRLLYDIQLQNELRYLGMDWGNLTKLFKHLPRLTYKRIVLQRASWKLDKKDFEDFLEGKIDGTEWTKKFHLPNHFVLVDGDNELVVDTSSDLSVAVFKDLIKKRHQISLCESLSEGTHHLVKDADQRGYANEFIGVLLKKEEEKVNPVNEKAEKETKKEPQIKRKYVAGSNWLYYKLYCGLEYADTLISEILYPLAEKFKQENIVSHWFFIRYKEEHFHIRFRLHFPQSVHQGHFMELFSKALEKAHDEGLIWKIELSTYLRELERYGHETIEFSERLFYHDSVSVAKSIVELKELGEGNLREMAAFLSIDSYFDLFNFTLEQKQQEVAKLKEQFGKEFGLQDKVFRKSLDAKYRSLRKELDSIFNGSYAYNTRITSILHARSSSLKKEGFDLQTVKMNLPSYLHMNINRLFPTQQRFNEFILYYCLSKHYDSMIARKKYSSKVQ